MLQHFYKNQNPWQSAASLRNVQPKAGLFVTRKFYQSHNVAHMEPTKINENNRYVSNFHPTKLRERSWQKRSHPTTPFTRGMPRHVLASCWPVPRLSGHGPESERMWRGGVSIGVRGTRRTYLTCIYLIWSFLFISMLFLYTLHSFIDIHFMQASRSVCMLIYRSVNVLPMLGAPFFHWTKILEGEW